MLQYRPYIRRCASNIQAASLHHIQLQRIAPSSIRSASTVVADDKLKISRVPRSENKNPKQAAFKGRSTPKREGKVNEDGEITPRKVWSIKFTDPLQLAESTLAKLRRDNFQEALELVRKNSAALECVVSWNHLIDYQCKHRRINAAIKTYNEMKKRGQVPDAYTYTIIFRGLASTAEVHKSSLASALSIYHSMHADKAPVVPNLIHTNAVLMVCAKAGDLDAMFGIAAKLKDKGIRAPNSRTYTIIFNAMRQTMIKLEQTMSADEIERVRGKAIMQARGMWQDIVRRWRQGDLHIDEELVCAMGRILSHGSRADVRDISALLRQTMKLPQLIARSPHVVSAPKQAALSKPEIVADEEELEEWEGKTYEHEAQSAPPTSTPTYRPKEEFPIVNPPKNDRNSKGASGSGFAVPGANTLDLLMDGYKDPKFVIPAMLYWKILTEEYNVKPDAATYHGYLRVLRSARRSTEASLIVKSMPAEMISYSTIIISMAACSRDKTNPEVFANASRILDAMQQNLSRPDERILHNYLDIALESGADIDPERYRLAPKPVAKPEVVAKMSQALEEAGFANYQGYQAYLQKLTTPEEPKQLADWEVQEATYAKGRRILHALSRCEPSVKSIKAYLAYSRDVSEKTPKKAYSLKLIQRMVAAYSLLINKGLVPREKFRYVIESRGMLQAIVKTYAIKYDVDLWKGLKDAAFKTWTREGFKLDEEGKVKAETYVWNAKDEVEKAEEAEQKAEKKVKEKPTF